MDRSKTMFCKWTQQRGENLIGVGILCVLAVKIKNVQRFLLPSMFFLKNHKKKLNWRGDFVVCCRGLVVLGLRRVEAGAVGAAAAGTTRPAPTWCAFRAAAPGAATVAAPPPVAPRAAACRAASRRSRWPRAPSAPASRSTANRRRWRRPASRRAASAKWWGVARGEGRDRGKGSASDCGRPGAARATGGRRPATDTRIHAPPGKPFPFLLLVAREKVGGRRGAEPWAHSVAAPIRRRWLPTAPICA